ncbi:MAG: PstA family ABC transporter permease [Candidatus Sumerlaeia bacterium]|nr:PstA family ABC transporter permease [Candidatus Sumerlaeia bacterium]
MKEKNFDATLGRVKTAMESGSRAPMWALVFETVVKILTGFVVAALAFILFTIITKGGPHVSWEFLSQPPRDTGMAGGVWPAIFGTFFVVLFMIMMAIPLGVFGAVYLVEYSRGGFAARVIRAAVSNLAGVPSIVFGLFGLGFFVLFVGRNLDYMVYDIPRSESELVEKRARLEANRTELEAEARTGAEAEAARRQLAPEEAQAFVAQRVVEATIPSTRPVFGQGAMFWAAATLALLVLPVIIVSTEEALRAVPLSLREASYALGSTKWQMVRNIVLPMARSGILTGAILAVSRGAGELAPVLFVGVAAFKPDLPLTDPVDFGLFEVPVVNPFTSFMHLNYHIYTLATQSPDPDATRGLQFATTAVLVLLTVALNLAAIRLRNLYSARNR